MISMEMAEQKGEVDPNYRTTGLDRKAGSEC